MMARMAKAKTRQPMAMRAAGRPPNLEAAVVAPRTLAEFSSLAMASKTCRNGGWMSDAWMDNSLDNVYLMLLAACLPVTCL